MIDISILNQISLAINIGTLWGKAWPVILAILFFGVIIFVHELGHFTFAKLFKIKVNEFALGMGPTLFKIQGKETKYALRLFPIGGFVNMEGENEESDDENSFGKKKCWKRIIVVVAGAIMNLILGFVLLTIMLSNSDLIGTRQIAGFQTGAVSSSYGLKAGDEIVKIDNKNVISEMDLSYLLMRDKDGNVDITVKRDGEKALIENVQFQMREGENGNSSMFFDLIIIGAKPTFVNTVKYSFLEGVSMAKIVYISLFDLVTGQYGFNDLAGPIGTVGFIADAAETATKETDYTSLLMIMALITINIGLFNLLPIPALDGGRLFFMLIELIRKKPINQKYEGWIHATGFAILILFMIIVSASDVLKLIKGG